MSIKIIGNHGGTWGIEHDSLTPETWAKAHAENYYGTLLVVSDEEAAKVIGKPVNGEYDSSGEIIAPAVWPQHYQRA